MVTKSLEFYKKRQKAFGQKDTAEEMIKTGDFANAKKNLLETLDVFPMDHILPFLTVCDILLLSSYHIPGCNDIDYRKILLLEPSSTPEEITFRYNKLLAMLEPLKHSFPGTKLALKFINESFSALSGNERPGTFDSRRSKDFQECSHKGIDLILGAEMDSIHVTDSPEQTKDTDLFLDAEMDFIHVPDSPECSNKGIDLFLDAEMDLLHVTDPPECSNKGIDLFLDAEMDLLHVTDPPECLNKGIDLILDAEMDSIHVTDPPECSNKGIDLILSAKMDSVHVTGPSSSASKRVYRDFFDFEEGRNIGNIKVGSVHVTGPSSSASKQIHQDFFDFEEGRNIGNIEVGEIWATRDHHRYVRIRRKSSFSVVVIKLKPVPVTDREKRWYNAGLPVGCSCFSPDLDSGEILCSPKDLSHKCTWNISLNQKHLSIYPRKGDIWAIYNDLHFVNCETYNPLRIASFGYCLVEVLLDICPDFIGIECAFLDKVEGFKAVFRRKLEGNSSGVFRLPPRDFFLLSHKLPAVRLSGNEAEGIESGMWEVDHLSVPNHMMTLPFEVAKEWP